MTHRPLSELEHRDDFVQRHIGPGPADLAAMLDAVGITSLDELIDDAVPKEIRDDHVPDVPGPSTEAAVLARLRTIASMNEPHISLIGAGYFGTFMPPVILRNVLENPGWYTAYTPYQPEISQGRLEALLNFQTMVTDLTGMEIANASLLDEGTAAAEAMAMVKRVGRNPSPQFVVDGQCHPQTIEVVRTRAEPLGIEIVVGDPAAVLDEVEPFGVLFQSPATSGAVRDLTGPIERVHQRGGLAVVAVDPLGLALLKPPGDMGADVAVGSSQRFGVPMMFGGPHAAFVATRAEYQRQMPGRVVGVTRDDQDRMALRLALQTREQHIRRERATSNICTAQVLLAVLAGMYGVYHGPDGLATIAQRVHRLTSILAAGLRSGGIEVVNGTWFDTLTVRVDSSEETLARARDRRINLRSVDPTTVGVSLDETTTVPVVDALFEIFGVAATVASIGDVDAGIPGELERTSEYLTHPVFHSHRSETEMLRYLRYLQDKDVALDRSMIPLGSCTMKLNASVEMFPVTWPEFADMHPFAPLDQAEGYLQLIDDLERWLVEITGYDAVSLQPNSGAQGEFAGLLAIRAYHQSRGEGNRDVCLIPASAHGTNPASATMAGLRVVVVKTDDDGSIDVDDLSSKVEEHADRLAAIMVTYPSTHGVFEEHITQVCDLVHDHGGQVYLDGANLNAMVGIARPGVFGADVSHLNLHKTFAIPHGGGGPGVGPIGVKEHLAPFLPGHGLVPDQPGAADGVGAVASAPWGSAGVLSISWAYIALMGGSGLRSATEVAILSANYVAARLEPHYPVLYRGATGRVAHECIIDLRPVEAETGVDNEDVAKRLIDYGFHAPTMSFPVPGTLMIEPTESEPKAELDRFCDAMIAIDREIAAIADGAVDVESSVLRNAPHPAEDVTDDAWKRPYSRGEAAYPVDSLRRDKYWVPVSRIDNAWGDRHVMCFCPPMEVYEQGFVDES
jgi:glycine dehydrogenase